MCSPPSAQFVSVRCRQIVTAMIGEGDADRSRSTPNPFHWSYVLYFVYGFDVSLLSPYATPCSGLMVSVW